jgi:hypothetical protein
LVGSVLAIQLRVAQSQGGQIVQTHTVVSIRTLIVTAGILLVWLTQVGAPDQSLHAQNKAAEPLKAKAPTITVSSAPGGFDVAISNDGDRDITFNLGMMLANNRQMFPLAISLVITDEAGIPRTFEVDDFRVAGRVDPYLVPLRQGGSYRVRVAFNELHSINDGPVIRRPSPGKQQVRAILNSTSVRHANSDMSGIQLIELWTGRAESRDTVLQIPEQKREVE